MQHRIGVAPGAFDVANYGDQLFPLIAWDQLTARMPDPELVCHAPAEDGDLPPGVRRYSPWSRAAGRRTGPGASTSRDISTPC